MNHRLIVAAAILFSVFSCDSEKASKKDEIEIALPTENIKKQESKPGGNTFTGRVAVKPNAELSVHMPINGYLEELKCTVGTEIKKGAILAYIQHPDILKLQEDYLRTSSEFRVEEENYERKKELFEQKVISRKEFLEAEKLYEASSAHYKRLIAELRFVGIDPSQIKKVIIEKLAIRSPGNGIVTEIKANRGMFLSDSDQLLTIIDTSSIWFEFQVYPDQLEGLMESDTIDFRYGNEKGKAIVNHISIATNSSQAVSVFCTPVNKKGSWKIGQVLFGEIRNK